MKNLYITFIQKQYVNRYNSLQFQSKNFKRIQKLKYIYFLIFKLTFLTYGVFYMREQKILKLYFYDFYVQTSRNVYKFQK